MISRLCRARIVPVTDRCSAAWLGPDQLSCLTVEHSTKIRSLYSWIIQILALLSMHVMSKIYEAFYQLHVVKNQQKTNLTYGFISFSSLPFHGRLSCSAATSTFSSWSQDPRLAAHRISFVVLHRLDDQVGDHRLRYRAECCQGRQAGEALAPLPSFR